jgi:hypothetical protein
VFICALRLSLTVYSVLRQLSLSRHTRSVASYRKGDLLVDLPACVHFPHHCPCAWEAHEEKYETGDGHRICVSKSGAGSAATARKVELARKGLL